MWLDLEAGSARSLQRQTPVPFQLPPFLGPRRGGRRAMIVEAAQTMLPEADLECLPELAAAEIDAGLGGPLRIRIAGTTPTGAHLPQLRDELVAELGGSADVGGALRLVDRVYSARLVRREVPPIITACCLCWYGHWRSGNDGPALATADELNRAVQAWIAQPGRRNTIDAQITDAIHSYVGDDPTAFEDLHI